MQNHPNERYVFAVMEPRIRMISSDSFNKGLSNDSV
jgi:hypothetical protein